MSALSVRPSFRALPAALMVSVLAIAGLMGPSAQAQRIGASFFGMHANDWTKPPTVPVGSANFTTSGTYWTSIQPTNTTPNWAKLTKQVEAAEAIGAQPMIVLGRSPQWASSRPGSPDYADYMPSITAWRSYVQQVVTRFGNRLDYQIWPEPNVIENWKGSSQQMATLTATASTIIKAHASRPKVVSPSFTLRMKYQRAWMVDYFKKSVNGKRVHQYLDVIAINPFPEQSGGPEQSYGLIKTAKQLLANIKVSRPMWNNEINYGVAGGGEPTTTTYSVDKQQAYVIRTYVLNAAARVQRTYWLGWFSTQTMAVKMTDAFGNPRQPAKSYEVVRTWLNGTDFSGCQKLKSGLWVCRADTATEIRRIYWHPNGTATVTTPLKSLRREDQEGGVFPQPGSSKISVNYRPVMVAAAK